MTTDRDISHIEHQLNSHDQRIQALERWKNAQSVDDARREEKEKHMDKRFDRLEESVNEVKGYLLKIVWVIIVGIVGYFMTFVMNGGLNIAP